MKKVGRAFKKVMNYKFVVMRKRIRGRRQKKHKSFKRFKSEPVSELSHAMCI